MKFKENMKGKYRVKMRGKVEYVGTNALVANNWKDDLDYDAYKVGKTARATVEYHDGYRWEKCIGW